MVPKKICEKMYTHVHATQRKLSNCTSLLNLLPNDKILEWSKLNVTKQLKLGKGRIEIIVGQRKNAGYQHFVLFPKCFQKAIS